ncbi:MYG1 family protein [Patescibacteria group bacterium]|nr:MYG1 family protein [Patescibacteria group bacterium]
MKIKKKFRIVTHSGTFHVDDVFAVATLKIFLTKKYGGMFYKPQINVLRTRNLDLIKEDDYIVDLAGEYDFKKLIFDHHQIGGAGGRENGIAYSAFGLVWKDFGEEICGSCEVAEEIDKKVTQPIDAMDNGMDLYSVNIEGVNPYLFYDVISTFNFVSQRRKNNGINKNFAKMVSWAEDILLMEIERVVIEVGFKKEIEEIYKKTEDKRLIVFEEDYNPRVWQEVLQKYPEPLFVIKPDNRNGGQTGIWKMKNVNKVLTSFEARKDLPEAWAGKTGKELQEITGVEDAIFCHTKRFIVTAGSKEGILKLAELALKE